MMMWHAPLHPSALIAADGAVQVLASADPVLKHAAYLSLMQQGCSLLC